MSEPELAYMGGNDEFDLPRWQTQTQTQTGREHDYLSSSAQAAQHAQAQQPYLSPYAPPPPQQRLPLSAIDDSQSTSLPYLSTTNHSALARSASLGASALTSVRGRRQHHSMQDDIEGNPAAYSSPTTTTGSSHARQHSNSFYPSQLAYDTASPPDAASYQDLYFSTGQSGPAPKRSLTHHDSSSSRAGNGNGNSARSPLRSNPPPQQAFLDPYTSSQQQSQYSPTSTTFSSYQSPPYTTQGGHSRSQSKSGTDVLQSPYTPSHSTSAAVPPPPSVSVSAQQARYSPSYGMPMDTSSPHPPPSSHALPPPAMQLRQNSISQPSTPLQFPVPSHSPAYGGADAMQVDPPQKRRASGFRRVRDQRDLRPHVNQRPMGRRVDVTGIGLSVRSFFFSFPCLVCFGSAAFVLLDHALRSTLCDRSVFVQLLLLCRDRDRPTLFPPSNPLPLPCPLSCHPITITIPFFFSLLPVSIYSSLFNTSY